MVSKSHYKSVTEPIKETSPICEYNLYQLSQKCGVYTPGVHKVILWGIGYKSISTSIDTFLSHSV